MSTCSFLHIYLHLVLWVQNTVWQKDSFTDILTAIEASSKYICSTFVKENDYIVLFFFSRHHKIWLKRTIKLPVIFRFLQSNPHFVKAWYLCHRGKAFFLILRIFNLRVACLIIALCLIWSYFQEAFTSMNIQSFIHSFLLIHLIVCQCSTYQ